MPRGARHTPSVDEQPETPVSVSDTQSEDQASSTLVDATTREAREALSEKDKVRFREAKTAAYTKAQTKIREDHLAEFNQIQIGLLAEAGFEWKPELTEAEKAAATVERLMFEHPELEEQLRERLLANVSGSSEVPDEEPAPAEGLA